MGGHSSMVYKNRKAMIGTRMILRRWGALVRPQTFLVALFFFPLSGLFCAPEIALPLKNETIPAEPLMQYIRDSNQEFTVKDLAIQNDPLHSRVNWKPVPYRGFHFGTVAEPIWLRLQLRNDSPKKRDFSVRFLYNFIDDIRVYDSRGELLYHTGLKHPRSTRPIVDNHFAFPFTIHGDSSLTLLFRVDTRTAFAPSAQLFPTRLHGFVFFKDNLPAIIYGVIALVLFLYNGFLYLNVRMKAYLNYSLFILFFFLYQFFLEGFGYLFLNDDHKWNQSMVHTLSQVALFFHVGYAIDLIGLKKARPQVYRFYHIARWFVFSGSILYFLGFYSLEKLVQSLVNGLLFLSFLPLGIDALRRLPRVAWYFLIGWFVFATGMLVYIGLTLGLVPFTEEVIALIQVANVVEAISFSWALSVRLKELVKRDNNGLESNVPAAFPLKESPSRRSYLIGTSPEKINHDLEALMNEEKLYLDESLRMQDLAERVGVNRYQLSAFFNEFLETGYHPYITKLRVEHAKEMIQKNPDYSLIRIGLDSGFSSKSTFYDAFRKHFGETPGSFRARLKR